MLITEKAVSLTKELKTFALLIKSTKKTDRVIEDIHIILLRL